MSDHHAGRDPKHVDVVAEVLSDMDLVGQAQLKTLCADARTRGIGLLDHPQVKELVPSELLPFVERAADELVAKKSAPEASDTPATPAHKPGDPTPPQGFAPPSSASGKRKPSSRRYVPKRLRSDAEVPDIDISSLKKELNLGCDGTDAAKEDDCPEAHDADAELDENSREKRIEHYVRRIMPTMEFYTCFGRAIRRHGRNISIGWLARDAGVKPQVAASALAHWHKCGLLKQEVTGLQEYFFSPDKQNERLFNDLQLLMQEAHWHTKFLEWVLDEEKKHQ